MRKAQRKSAQRKSGRVIEQTVLLAAAISGAFACNALAAYRLWANATSGNFTDGVNWSPSGVPTAADSAIIDATGANYTVSILSNETVTPGTLTLNSANATLAATGSVTTSSFYLLNGTVNGQVTISAAGSLTFADVPTASGSY